LAADKWQRTNGSGQMAADKWQRTNSDARSGNLTCNAKLPLREKSSQAAKVRTGLEWPVQQSDLFYVNISGTNKVLICSGICSSNYL
jgi:hypothetical protein